MPPPSHHQTHSHSHGGGTVPLSRLKKEKEEEEKLRHQLEIAKTMVMDLPQPRSPAQNISSHIPSPRPSPVHGKSSLIRSKKVSSASPSDREGHYPCNRCGRSEMLALFLNACFTCMNYFYNSMIICFDHSFVLLFVLVLFLWLFNLFSEYSRKSKVVQHI